MGGERTCPDDCPLAIWATLSPADRKRQRQSVAERLYREGFTMEAIATQLGVTKQCISLDLGGIVKEFDNQKPAKTASNPKGSGRPKGSKKRRPAEKSDSAAASMAAALVLDGDRTLVEAALETGVGSVQVVKTAVAKEEGRRDPQVDRASLSQTAQKKFDAAIRQHLRELSRQFEDRVREGIKQRIDQMVLPHWRERIEEAQELYARRRGLMDKETFNTIRRALHPDSRFSITDQKLSEAFNAFMRLEKFLLDEKDSPTDLSGLPRTWAEWEQAKRDTTAARRARRRAGQSSALRTR
jgi:hypothetical protein